MCVQCMFNWTIGTSYIYFVSAPISVASLFFTRALSVMFVEVVLMPSHSLSSGRSMWGMSE